MKDSLDYCRFLNEFINEKLSGNIDDLKNFNFQLLKDDKKFGKVSENGSVFDEDDTEIARCIYYLIFNNQILKDTLNFKYDDIGTGKKYRGDTLYTFNTYFGTDMQCAKDLSDNNENFLSKVREFNKKYCSIGNFTILPNLTVNGTTLNCYRGIGSGWKDFFGRFLYELKKCFENDEMKDLKLDALIKANAFYFVDKVNSIELFKQINFLEPSFTVLGEVKDHLWETYTISREKPKEYITWALEYINTAERIIHYRAEKMISILKKSIEISGNL